MLNQSQIDWVKVQLLKNKKIGRNMCLNRYITRLSAIIYTLREDGWEFKAGYDENRDYWYHVTKKPHESQNISA